MNSSFRFLSRRFGQVLAGVFALSVVSLNAAPFGLADASSVRAALAPRSRAELLRVEHCVRGVARVSFATVFEFNGILWLYRPERGTESIASAPTVESSRRLSLESLVAPLFEGCSPNGPAIVAIEAAERSPGLPRNGCVPEAIAFLRRLATEQPVEEARLLFYYFREVIPGTALFLPQAGHTVLVARVGGLWRAYDVMANREQPLGRELAEAIVSARVLEPRSHREILSARYLTVPAEEF